ncbi:MAG: hypothetical protein JWM16_1550 [Verrucomicrobiales bacterium]|nr:hypothetical protein [Verrucomicrobiales bacterium]
MQKHEDLFTSYQPAEGVYDEMAAAAGELRPHWARFAQMASRLGLVELASRSEEARRNLRENGVTYNVYGDPQGMDRPWAFDLIPLLISASEWKGIEAGLIQRATLLNKVLADLYGPRTLLQEAGFPPSLLYGNPGFLRPCHGVKVPNDTYLHLLAVDLARAADGKWWVLSDRTQAPSGAGYALENRIIASRRLPGKFRDCQVQRLAPFFHIFRENLLRLAPPGRTHPRVVLLTPGPHNETYFEHAYLARYLGFQLVEGSDLTVYDRKVYIKTLEGLQRVDVIVRRLDDSFCDPLELRSDSFLGILGLVEAVRNQTVTIANALGSGLIETPAMIGFLPGLCKLLLEEELLMPSVATWWCGQSKPLQYVIDHFDSLVIKGAFSGRSRPPAFGHSMTASQKQQLIEQMRATPHEYVGQEMLSLSTTPTLTAEGLEPRPMVLRTYIAACGNSYVVFPGGLTRISSAVDKSVVSMQSGGGSKDTWVLSDKPVPPMSLLAPAGQIIRVGRSAAEIPSRVADNFFWLGRYAERLEMTVRTIRTFVERWTDEAAQDTMVVVGPLLELMVHLRMVEDVAPMPSKTLEIELSDLVFNSQRPFGITETLHRLRGTVWTVRDRLSVDTWRIFNQLTGDMEGADGASTFPEIQGLLDRMIIDLAAFSGMEMENMTRGHGWRFLEIGRRLERGTQLVAIVQAALKVNAKGAFLLEPLLEIADSSMTYRRRYFSGAQPAPVLDLLLADEGNPRALAFQVAMLLEHLKALPVVPDRPFPEEPARRLESLLSSLRQANFVELTDAAADDKANPLAVLLTDALEALPSLSDAITQVYFTHVEQQVG